MSKKQLELCVKENNKAIATSSIEIKKSQFIAKVYYIKNKQDAENKIIEARKQYKDARHVIYAYMLKEGGKFTDDKEPQGTAGKPIYSLLEKSSIINILVIVIRHFGGVLLGTGPLTRAYTTAAKEAISLCDTEDYIEYDIIEQVCEYSEETNMLKRLKTEGAEIQSITREDKVKIIALFPKNRIK